MLIYVIILVLLLIFTKILYKDYLCPAFIMLIPWTISFFILKFSDFYYHPYNSAYWYIIGGILAFQIGFLFMTFINKNSLKSVKVVSNSITYDLDTLLLKVIVIIEYSIMIYYSYYLFKLGQLYTANNFILSLNTAFKSGEKSVMLAEYGKMFIFFFTIYLYMYYHRCSLKNKKIYIKYTYLQIPVFILSLILNNGRARDFFFIITIAVIVSLYNNYSNRKVLKMWIKLIFILMVLFIIFTILKFNKDPYKIFEDIRNYTLTYFSGSLPAFEHWFSNNNGMVSFGENTFRIFKAIFNRVGFNVEVPTTYFPFYEIGPNNIGNVYTIYYTYIYDFGKIGGILIQFLLGIIYEFLYKKSKTKKTFWVYIYGLSFYPLLMQFFADQYVAITSQWLQLLFCGLIGFKTNIFHKKYRFQNSNNYVTLSLSNHNRS